MRWSFQMAFAAMLSTSALAQEDDAQIVVEGERPDALRTLREVRALSRNVSGNLARFETPVCPGVIGMPTRLAGGIVRRMRADVVAVGVRLAPAGCAPNLTVIVTDDGAALIDGLLRKSPTLFGNQSKLEIDALRRSTGPAWAWQTSQPKRADGMAVPMLDQVSPGQAQTSKRAYAVPHAKMSRLASSVRQDTGLAFVVLSRAAIEGKTLAQIADYGVLRGLAGTTPDAGVATGAESIVGLFGVNPPAKWTEFDRAYLISLYSGTNGLTYEQKTREIAQDVARKLDR